MYIVRYYETGSKQGWKLQPIDASFTTLYAAMHRVSQLVEQGVRVTVWKQQSKDLALTLEIS